MDSSKNIKNNEKYNNFKKIKNKLLNCVICNSKLQGNQRKYCSNRCKQKGHYQNEKNNNTYHSQTKRGLRRKLLLVFMKGGECEECGYNKNLSALEFHHERDKEFGLDLRKCANTKLSTLLKEFKKCRLLCSNCHKEHHYTECNVHYLINIIGDSLEKSNDANWMNSVEPLAMAILSQALKAFKEGAETSGEDTILSCNTTLASNILTSNVEDDDIVQPSIKVEE